LRQVVEIKAPYAEKRRFARMFDGLFEFSTDTSPIDTFIRDFVEGVGSPDTTRNFQLRAASTNMFLFGNTNQFQENTLAYIGTGFVISGGSVVKFFHSEEIIKSVLLNMGFDRQSLSDRIKRYQELFEKYEYFWRRGTLQQVFVAPQSVTEDTYVSYPFGSLDILKLEEKETKDPLVLLSALRKNPIEAAETLVNQNNYDNVTGFVDQLQARLLWNPKDIQDGKIILETVDLFNLTDLKQLDKDGIKNKIVDLKKQKKRAQKDLEKLVLEDLADWLKISDLEGPQDRILGEGVGTTLPLLQLKKAVSKEE